MRWTLAVAVSLVPLAARAQDATVPYKENGFGFAVTAKDGGASYDVMIASWWGASSASKPALAAGRVSLSIGGVPMGSEILAVRQLANADGAIGMDLLGNMALGFDLYDHKLAIWAHGSPGKQASDWVGKIGAWAGFGGEAVAIPFEIDSIGLPTVQLNALGRDHKALLMTTVNASAVFDAADVKSENLGSGVFVNDVRIGGETVPWLRDSKTINGGRSPYPGLGVTALLSLEDLLSPRVVIDFPDRKIYVWRMGPEGRLTMMLDGLLRVPVQFTSTGLRVGGPLLTKGARIAAYEGCKVSKIADEPEAQIRKMLAVPTAESRKWLNSFLAKVQGVYSLWVVHKDGSEAEVRVGEKGE
jgi:hypothetical protein